MFGTVAAHMREPSPGGPTPRNDVLLGWCASSHVTTLFLDSVARLYESDRARERIAGHLTYLGGPDLRVSRTVLTESLLAHGAPWLLQVDTDMVFTPDDFTALLAVADAQACPIVGGLYTGYTPHNGETIPVVCKHFFWDQSSEFFWLQ
ncbi:hypothetical protein ACFWP3_40330 [Streptomyces sp. NPDC058525]|uniref:hypothetical protein n=1 Tax=Streptomyces sp. NPDC058525 TaxID=3346538 RepID=UPI003657DBA5